MFYEDIMSELCIERLLPRIKQDEKVNGHMLNGHPRVYKWCSKLLKYKGAGESVGSLLFLISRCPVGCAGVI